MRTSQSWLVRPTCTGVPTAVRVPSLFGLRWLAWISVPKAVLPSGQLSHAPTVATVSANTTLAPPCKKPIGWTCRPSTGIVITTRSGSVSAYSMPRFLTRPSLSFRESTFITSAISPPVGRFFGFHSHPVARRSLQTDRSVVLYRPFGRKASRGGAGEHRERARGAGDRFELGNRATAGALYRS